MEREYLGHRLLEGLDQKLDPRHTALIVVDMQNDFIRADGYLGGSEACEATIEPTRSLAEAARAVGVTVHFAQIVQESDGSAASPVWISEALDKGYEPLQCMAGTWGARNVDELTPQPGDRIHLKRRRSAFFGTTLGEELLADGIKSVIVTGLAATGCVEYTVRSAFERDLNPIVALDAIANKRQPPDHSWAEHYGRFIPEPNLVTTAQIESLWARNSTPKQLSQPTQNEVTT